MADDIPTVLGDAICLYRLKMDSERYILITDSFKLDLFFYLILITNLSELFSDFDISTTKKARVYNDHSLEPNVNSNENMSCLTDSYCPRTNIIHAR